MVDAADNDVERFLRFKKADDERGEELPDVDPHVEDRKRGIPARIVLSVKLADESGDVRPK